MKIAIGGGVRLFVDVEGPEWVPDGPTLRQKPTLICLHGGPGFDHSAFKPIFSRLADLVQIIYYDHRGHGRSDERPQAEWTLDTWADDVVRLCDALGIVKPIVLGQSFGGFVAQHYLARHPEHASKIILSSTSPNMVMARKLAMFEKLGGPAARDLALKFWSEPTPASWAAYWAGCRKLYNSSEPRDPDAGQRTLLREDILLHFVGGEKQGMDLLPGLARAQCPVLVMAGEEDPVCPLDDARDMAAALPAQWAQFVSFPGVGHGAWRDDPEAAFATLRQFIQA
ncbi:alpha/beta hydrolase [Paucibacter sp. B2R-40]|uniref:alpha/beta fold hydrolase n=1 Tax=Paucibacter sp. B2R-40 TaxID=2893554 RepID=UPI0021E40363|nr:alpha/beta hydrolase [Paucibacter sp. B2R-40]MCV2356963.1 alpha/beta hydrolase [Paucibacter sp. B2R-40]